MTAIHDLIMVKEMEDALDEFKQDKISRGECLVKLGKLFVEMSNDS